MLRILKIFPAMLIFSLFFNCGGSKAETRRTEVKKKADVPAWYLVPPNDDTAIYAVAMAKKSSLQLAMDTAKSRGRDELSRVVSVKVSTMIKDFLQEAGSVDASIATEFSSSVSKSVASNVLSGSSLQQQEIYEIDADGDGNTDSYEVYACMKIGLTDLSGKINDAMKQNAAAYAKLQANKSFEELEEELRAMKGTDPDLRAVVTEYED